MDSADSAELGERLVRRIRAELSSFKTKINGEYTQKCGVIEQSIRIAQQRIQSLNQERTAQRNGKAYT